MGVSLLVVCEEFSYIVLLHMLLALAMYRLKISCFSSRGFIEFSENFLSMNVMIFCTQHLTHLATANCLPCYTKAPISKLVAWSNGIKVPCTRHLLNHRPLDWQTNTQTIRALLHHWRFIYILYKTSASISITILQYTWAGLQLSLDMYTVAKLVTVCNDILCVCGVSAHVTWVCISVHIYLVT